MTQIFVFTAGRSEARRHLARSIVSPIDESDVFDSFDELGRGELERIQEEGNGGFYAWGAVPGEANERYWRAMERGDYVLCVYDNAYHHAARVLGTHNNRRFAERVWDTDSEGETWQYMYFLTEPVEVGASVPELGDYLNRAYFGFTRIRPDKVDAIIDEFGTVDEFTHQMLGGPRGGTGATLEEVEDPDTVLEVATSGDVNPRKRLRTAPPARRISREVLQNARRNADRIGQLGEQFVNDHITILKNRGEIEDFEWVSRENAGSAYDFWIRRNGEREVLDAKSTESAFDSKMHISLGELRQMSNGAERYDIYRVFEMDEATAKLRVAEDVSDWASAIIDVLDELPEGVTADSIAVPPSSLPFGPEMEVRLLE